MTNPLQENNRICFIQMPLLPARAKIAQPKHRGRREINSSHRVQGKFEIQIGMFSSYYKHWGFFYERCWLICIITTKLFGVMCVTAATTSCSLKKKRKQTVMQHCESSLNGKITNESTSHVSYGSHQSLSMPQSSGLGKQSRKSMMIGVMIVFICTWVAGEIPCHAPGSRNAKRCLTCGYLNRLHPSSLHSAWNTLTASPLLLTGIRHSNPALASTSVEF